MNTNSTNIFTAFQRFPTQGNRRPVNRRIGNIINSGFRRGPFPVKQIKKNVKPAKLMPNLAKFPGNAQHC